MIFVDSNIPMYLVGQSDAHRSSARELVEQAISRHERLVTSAEVLQEILHRFVAINRRDGIQPAFDVLTHIADEVYSIETSDVDRARAIVLARPALSARDALHVAVMERNGISRIMSFDRHFDDMPGIERLPSGS